MLFHFSSPHYYARYWSTWDTQQSLSLSVNIFVKRYSLSIEWTSMTTYGADQGAPTGLEHLEHPEELVEIPVDTPPPAPTVAFTEHILEEHIIATQTQHTSILRQIRYHLGIISVLEHAIPSPPEPSQAPPFVHQTMPPEEPTIGEAKAAEPSSPHHPPATI
ncbi:hypothetical protein CK203_101724 [Vitis vinifera]|uniref:Uncharacterized protein n=1 Tax=Vitis vinifera TaxID=29760 RepID=A0A438DQT8_VITVI|nr:hypothetical protein CK203_101724 [Vitis vinifera]